MSMGTSLTRRVETDRCTDHGSGLSEEAPTDETTEILDLGQRAHRARLGNTARDCEKTHKFWAVTHRFLK